MNMIDVSRDGSCQFHAVLEALRRIRPEGMCKVPGV